MRQISRWNDNGPGAVGRDSGGVVVTVQRNDELSAGREVSRRPRNGDPSICIGEIDEPGIRLGRLDWINVDRERAGRVDCNEVAWIERRDP